MTTFSSPPSFPSDIFMALMRWDWVNDCGAKHDTLATLTVNAKSAGMVYLTIFLFILRNNVIIMSTNN